MNNENLDKKSSYLDILGVPESIIIEDSKYPLD